MHYTHLDGYGLLSTFIIYYYYYHLLLDNQTSEMGSLSIAFYFLSLESTLVLFSGPILLAATHTLLEELLCVCLSVQETQ